MALCERISRKTASQLHGYLSDFGQGTHRLIWNKGRGFIELENLSDVVLVREQFPSVVRAEMRPNPHDFSW